MPKDLLNAAGSFGEGFISTLQSERDRKRKEQEFQQKMGLEMRQQKFMSSYYDALKKDREFDNQLAEAKFGTEQRSGYDESTDSLSPVGTLGEDLNKQFNGTFSPFEEGKRYTPKQGEAGKPNVGVLRSAWDNGFYSDYYGYMDNNGKEVITKVERRNPASNSSGGSGNDNGNEGNTPPINQVTLDEMISNYNKRNVNDNGGKIPMGSSLVSPDQWRIEANKVLTQEVKDAGLSQELLDKVWELADVKDSDTPQKKRAKLKNVIDQQNQFGDIQKRALYHYVEVRTR